MDKVKQGLRRRSTQLRQRVPWFSRKTSGLESSPPHPGSGNGGVSTPAPADPHSQGIDQALRPAWVGAPTIPTLSKGPPLGDSPSQIQVPAPLPNSSISIREPMTGSATSIPPVVSVPCLVAPSPHAVSDLTAQENLTPGVVVVPGTDDSSASPWRQAFNKLSDRDKAAFPFPNTDKREYIERILEATKASRDTWQRNRLKFTFRGNDIIVRDVADGLLTWLEKFKQVGDIAIQYDPVHAALPWAGIRLLLQIAVNNKEAMEAVLIGVERIARPLVRCAVYETLYLKLVPRLSIHKNLEGALEEFYIAVLKFLAFAKQYLEKNSTKRVLHGLLNVDGRSHFDSMEGLESLLLKEVAVAEAEMRKCNHRSLKGMNKKLRMMLEEIEKPLTRIDLNVKLMHEESRDHLQGEKRKTILQWLSQIQYEKHHRNAKEKLLENTGQWLLNKDEFREWRSSGASGILWLHGIPGAGKTKLICAVIDSLKSISQQDEPVVYFYCSRNEPHRRDPTKIMQAILKQLSVALPGLPEVVVTEYDEREKRGFAAGTLGFQESCDFVISLLAVYRQVTIIIDALDESNPEERGHFLESLRTLIQSPGSLTKIFVSSRDDIDIKLELEQVPNLYIEAKDNSEDIKRFIRREVTQSIDKRQLLRGNVSDELKKEIITTIEEGAKGMFQWADLQIKNLYKMKLENDVRDGLGKLPKTLEETYTQIWGDISSGTPRELEFAIKALMWVMCSRRPLNQKQWAQASYWPSSAPADGAITLFDLCRNLVTWDRQLDCVVFAHLSVREYLENRIFSAIEANLMAAETCLSLLNDLSYWPIAETSILPRSKDTFTIYSIVYWARHVEYAYDLSMNPRILDLLQDLLGTAAKPSEAYYKWKLSADILVQARWWDSEFQDTLYHLDSTPLNPLLAMSYFRFGKELKEHWKSFSVDINGRNSAGETLLLVASIQGNEWVMDFLLEKGADFNAASKRFANPLIAAIKQGQERAVLKLVDAGASVCANSAYYTDVLQAAVYEDKESVIKAIVTRDTKTQVTSATVIAANRGGGLETMGLLLAGDANTEFTKAAIVEIARRFDERIMQMLLTRTPNINITEAMSAAAGNKRSGHKVIKLLLSINPGIEITETTIAAAAGNENRGHNIIEFLLSKNLKITITKAVARTAARRKSGWGVMKLLLAGDTNTRITEAAIVEIAKRFDETIMQMLLAKTPNIDFTKAMSAAAGNKQSGHKVIKLLLSVNPKIEITERTIVAAAENEQTGYSVIEFLISKNLNITITEEFAAVAADRGNWKLMKLLLARDTNTDITEAAVIEIARGFDENIMQMLLTKTPEIKITEPAVIHIARRFSENIMQMLLTRDPAIEITETAIAAAAGNLWSSKSVIELLLHKYAKAEITEAAIAGAAGNQSSGYDAMEMLLSKTPKITVTKAVVKAAAEGKGREIMERLLAETANTEITESAVVEIARRFDESIMQMVFTKSPKIGVTEATIAAAAENLWSSKRVIELLLSKYPKTEITEAAVVAAAGNQLSGYDVIEMLLSKTPQITVTKAVVRAAAEKGRDRKVMKLLLARETNTDITEAAVVEISRRSDQDIMQMLLVKNPNTKITEAVVIAAASNIWSGEKVMRVLLTKNPNIEITEAVVTAAAENKLVRREMTQSSGKEIMKVLLVRDVNIEITDAAVVKIARKFDKDIIKLLLAKNPTKMTKAVITAMTMNGWNSDEITEFRQSVEGF